MEKMFAMVLMIQEDLITKHCFGDCGKAIIGGLVDDELGPLVPCRQEVCPHEDATMELGELENDGAAYAVTLRKLKAT